MQQNSKYFRPLHILNVLLHYLAKCKMRNCGKLRKKILQKNRNFEFVTQCKCYCIAYSFTVSVQNVLRLSGRSTSLKSYAPLIGQSTLFHRASSSVADQLKPFLFHFFQETWSSVSQVDSLLTGRFYKLLIVAIEHHFGFHNFTSSFSEFC